MCVNILNILHTPRQNFGVIPVTINSPDLRNLNEVLDVIFKQIGVIGCWGILCEIELIRMSLDFIEDQSTLVQVMAWCRQAPSHCLSQCWPRSLSLYSVTRPQHYNNVIMGEMASQITSLTIVYSNVYSGGDQSKHQSTASLAFVLGIHRGPVNSPHKWIVTRKLFPFDDVIMMI